MGGDVPVTVTVEGGKITAVEVGDNSETQGIGTNAIEQLPGAIVEAGTTDGVDGVAGRDRDLRRHLRGNRERTGDRVGGARRADRSAKRGFVLEEKAPQGGICPPCGASV